MSVQAITWAAQQVVLPSSHKFVLIALANYTGDTGMAFPSVETICRFTCQDDKTVRSALAALVKNGVIKDTGSRAGVTQQVRVYHLPCERPPKTGIFKTGERPPKDWRKTGERLEKDTQKRVADPIYTNHEPIGEASSLHPVLRISHEKEYDEVTKQMKIIDGNYSGMQKWCADDIILYSKLKKRRDELRVLLGRVV